MPVNNKKQNGWLSRIIYLVGVIGPVMTLPQVLKIWIGKNAAGVSVVSWGAYFILASFWVAYGIHRKEKPIILSYLLWMIMHILVISGTLIYS